VSTIAVEYGVEESEFECVPREIAGDDAAEASSGTGWTSRWGWGRRVSLI